MNTYLTICILSYNRPNELKRLLESINNAKCLNIEILISEDFSPKRKEIRQIVEEFKKISKFDLNYHENPTNYGYDKNLRLTASIAKGKWIMFMGDDDIVISSNLNKYIDFLKQHEDCGYILRRYIHEKNGQIEHFRYDNRNINFNKGKDSYIELFRRSVFISGFTFMKNCFNDFYTSDLDGTLLFQLYIQACCCIEYPSAYCDIIITKSFEEGIPFFGMSNTEKNLYTSGSNTIENSINFLKQVFKVCRKIDNKYHFDSSNDIIKTYSKYSFGYLYEHRDKGIKLFNKYAKEIKNIGLGNSIYFYIYYFMLLIFGKNISKQIIVIIKKILGRTPKL